MPKSTTVAVLVALTLAACDDSPECLDTMETALREAVEARRLPATPVECKAPPALGDAAILCGVRRGSAQLHVCASQDPANPNPACDPNTLGPTNADLEYALAEESMLQCLESR